MNECSIRHDNHVRTEIGWIKRLLQHDMSECVVTEQCDLKLCTRRYQNISINECTKNISSDPVPYLLRAVLETAPDLSPIRSSEANLFDAMLSHLPIVRGRAGPLAETETCYSTAARKTAALKNFNSSASLGMRWNLCYFSWASVKYAQLVPIQEFGFSRATKLLYGK